MPFYAPYMAHLVGLDTAFVCHPGHTGASTLAVRPHWGQLRSFHGYITHVATNPYPSNFSKTIYNFLDTWHDLLCQKHRIPVSWSPHWQWHLLRGLKGWLIMNVKGIHSVVQLEKGGSYSLPEHEGFWTEISVARSAGWPTHILKQTHWCRFSVDVFILQWHIHVSI